MDRKRLLEIERLLKIATDELSNLEDHRQFLIDQISSLKRKRESLLHSAAIKESQVQYPSTSGILTQSSKEDEKIRLFHSLFRGRQDVYARRFESRKTGKSGYQPDCSNEWRSGICQKPQIKCNRCDHRQFIPLSESVIQKHLMGRDPADREGKDFTLGIYPLLLDETCWFLAVDFDKSTWQKDAHAFRETCALRGVPASLERSRSGNGAHIWIFFSEQVPARLARNLGSLLLTETMERRPEISLTSYDRFFPNQDTMPEKGFGNLIALPLQRKPRTKGNAVFLDENLIPYPDQWSYLSSVNRLSLNELEQLVHTLSVSRQELGPHSSFADLKDEVPWEKKSFRDWKELKVQGPLPANLNFVLADRLYIPKQGLSPTLHNRLIRLAAFPNPEFQRAQAMRLSTFGKPRIVCCAEDLPEYIALPRGCLEELQEILQTLGVAAVLDDKRNRGTSVEAQLHGNLNEFQTGATEALLKHEAGVLVAPTAFGKTVVAAWLIAHRKVNTLVLVHRRQLMDQWIRRLNEFLKPQPGTIGHIGAGKKSETGLIDVAILQSLIREHEINPIVQQYGQIIVDECHHISAPIFEQIARAAKARYIVGFSATVERKDGHHPIIFMQCGPVRHRVSIAGLQASDQMTRTVQVRRTGFLLPNALAQLKSLTIHDVYECLVHDERRNKVIVNDILSCLEEGRSPLLLTERRSHLEYFIQTLTPLVPNLIVLSGGMGQKQRKEALSKLQNKGSRLLLATGRYLGEGFDDDRLDTMFLAMPISWKGTLAQYAGRLNRVRPGKTELTIYDYADLDVPMLKGMFQRRVLGYKQLGYSINDERGNISSDRRFFQPDLMEK
jgi:superfamily II DNA or RNA helicase